MQTKKKLLSALLLVFSIFFVEAQNTNSPYSRYGYGILNDKAIGASKAMGGISYGMRGENVNPGNPASYSSVDSLTFLFDIGISYRKSRFKSQGVTQNDDNGGLDYLAFQFPLSKRLGFSAGLLPYSSVGYSFGNIDTEHNVAATSEFAGEGGLSLVYGGLSFDVTKDLSVGMNVSYLFGKITHNSIVYFPSGSAITNSYSIRRLTVEGAKFDFGVQYRLPVYFRRRDALIIGAVYSPSTNLSTRVRGQITAIDTTYTRAAGTSKLPHTFGLGFTYFNGRNLTFGVDGTFQKWSGLSFPVAMLDGMSESDRFNDRWRVNAGVEYMVAPFERNYFKRIKFRGGVNYSDNSYINAYSQDERKNGGYKEYGVTLGFGLPFRDSYVGRNSYINITFEYNRLNPQIKSMIKEEYFGFSIGLNLNDLWFMKNKFR